MISPNSQAKGPVYAVVISEKGGAERREVFEATELSVGRVQGNDLMLPKGNVSKRHARLLYRDGRFIVTDLNSTNGTYVNRRRISQATIVREGDRIYIGDFVLRIELMGAPDSADRVSSGPVPAPNGAPNEEPPRITTESQPTMGRLASSKPADSPARAAMASHPDDDQSGHMRAAAPVTGTPSAERTVSTVRDDSDTQSIVLRRYLEKLFDLVAADIGCKGQQPTASDAPRVRAALERITQQVGGPPSNTTALQVRQSLEAEFLDAGPLRALLDDASVKQIVVSRFDRIVVASDAGRSPLTLPFSTPLAATWALARLCAQCGIPASATIDGRLPDGSRLSALQSSGPGGPVICIQRPKQRDESLEQLVRRGTISRAIATFLHQCLAVRSNVLVVGTHDSGAEAVLGALCQTADDATLLAIEHIEELVPESNRVRRVSAASPDVDLPELLRMAGRMPSTRVVVDVTAPRVATDVLHAISEGGDGVLAYLPSTSFRRALGRLSAGLAVECAGLSADQARDWIAASFDLVLEVARLRDGRSRVLRVAELSKLDDPQAPGQDIFTFLVERTAAGGAVEGAFAPSGVLPKVLDELAMRGVSIDTSLFTRPPSR